MQELLHTYIFLIPLLVGLSSELVKVTTEIVQRGAWNEGFFRPGGMPSSHSALVTSLLIVVWYKAGPESLEFAIAFVFASLIWYDAMNSRRAIGKHAQMLNVLQKREHLSERLGHSFKEVCGGIVFGAGVTLLRIWLAQ